MIGFLIVVATLTLYFTPIFIAFGRCHKNIVPIGCLNIFLGWTLIGWVICLILATINLNLDKSENK